MRWSEIDQNATKPVIEDAAAPKPGVLPDLAVVQLANSVNTDQGKLPAGTKGTIVHVFPAGQAYIMEFYEPFHVVATVEATDIAV